MFGSMRSGGSNTAKVIGSGFHSAGEKIRPNILFAMMMVTGLGILVSYFGFQMDGNEAIISGAGVGAIVAIVNLAGKILEDDFQDGPASPAETDDPGARTMQRPSVLRTLWYADIARGAGRPPLRSVLALGSRDALGFLQGRSYGECADQRPVLGDLQPRGARRLALWVRPELDPEDLWKATTT